MLSLGRRSHLETPLPGWRFSSCQEKEWVRRLWWSHLLPPALFQWGTRYTDLHSEEWGGTRDRQQTQTKLCYLYSVSRYMRGLPDRDTIEQGWGFERAWKRGQMGAPCFYSNWFLEATLQNTVKYQPFSPTSSSSVKAKLRAAGFAVDTEETEPSIKMMRPEMGREQRRPFSQTVWGQWWDMSQENRMDGGRKRAQNVLRFISIDFPEASLRWM